MSKSKRHIFTQRVFYIICITAILVTFPYGSMSLTAQYALQIVVVLIGIYQLSTAKKEDKWKWIKSLGEIVILIIVLNLNEVPSSLATLIVIYVAGTIIIANWVLEAEWWPIVILTPWWVFFLLLPQQTVHLLGL